MKNEMEISETKEIKLETTKIIKMKMEDRIMTMKIRTIMERTAPKRLVITTESDNGEPLLYALRQCFENLKIEFNVLN